jgi:hypothetical protein
MKQLQRAACSYTPVCPDAQTLVSSCVCVFSSPLEHCFGSVGDTVQPGARCSSRAAFSALLTERICMNLSAGGALAPYRCEQLSRSLTGLPLRQR